jgi:hypothetical protein
MIQLSFNRAKMAVDALEDYLKGPNYIIKDQAGLNSAISSDYMRYSTLNFFGKLNYVTDYLRKWFFLIFSGRRRWYRVEKEWREFYKTAIKKEFWKKYLTL